MDNTHPRTGRASPAARPAEMSAPSFPMRPRSLGGQVVTLLFQPGKFFRTLPSLQDSQQWFWIALLVLGLVAFSTVRTRSTTDSAGTGDGGIPTDLSNPPGLDLGGGGEGGGKYDDSGLSGLPAEGVPAAQTGSENSPDKVSDDWQKAAIAASNILLAWLILAVLLCEVPPLSSGSWPRFRQNLHIAVWASLPLGLMAALQLVYDWAGGQIGQPGLSGLLPKWSGYDDLTNGQQTLLTSLATRATLFEWWTVILVYIGARHALHGKRWVVTQAVLAWMVLILVIPVLTGSIKAPDDSPAPPALEIPGGDVMPGDEIPGDIEILPDGGEQTAPDSGQAVPVAPSGRKG